MERKNIISTWQVEKLRLREYELFFQSYILEKLRWEIQSPMLHVMPLFLFSIEKPMLTGLFHLFYLLLICSWLICFTIRRTAQCTYRRVLSLMDP